MLLPLITLSVLQVARGHTTGRCGIGGGTSKIVGGNTVSVDQYPWYVALVSAVEFSRARPGSSTPLTVICGSSLITARHAVSAGHCFAGLQAKGGNWKAKMIGVFGLSNRCTPTWKDASTFSNVVIHPQYNKDTVENDISLIYLAKDMSSFTPVCFPPAGPSGVKVTKVVVTTVFGYRSGQLAGERQTAPIGGPPSSTALPSIIGALPSTALPTSVTTRPTRHSGEVTIIGYGSMKEKNQSFPCRMMEATVVEYTRKQCMGTKVASQISNLPGVVCAGLKNGTVDSCQGDSGGPLMYQTKGVYTLEGIVSFGNGCARPDNPGVYTMVSYYRNWVTRHLNNMRGPPPNKIDYNRWVKCILNFNVKPCLNPPVPFPESTNTETEYDVISAPTRSHS